MRNTCYIDSGTKLIARRIAFMKNPGLDRFPLGFWSTLDAKDSAADAPKEWAEMGMTLTMGHRPNKKLFA